MKATTKTANVKSASGLSCGTRIIPKRLVVCQNSHEKCGSAIKFFGVLMHRGLKYMNNEDRKTLQKVIDGLEELKTPLLEMVESLDQRASNMEEKFPAKAEKLQDESSSVQEVIDSIDNVISDTQTVIESE